MKLVVDSPFHKVFPAFLNKGYKHISPFQLILVNVSQIY